MRDLTYWICTVIGCGLYAWVNDKPLETWFVGPYWTAITLLAVRYVPLGPTTNTTEAK